MVPQNATDRSSQASVHWRRSNKSAGRRSFRREGFRLSGAGPQTGSGVRRRERPKKPVCVRELVLRDNFLLVAIAGGNFIGSEDTITGAERCDRAEFTGDADAHILGRC